MPSEYNATFTPEEQQEIYIVIAGWNHETFEIMGTYTYWLGAETLRQEIVNNKSEIVSVCGKMYDYVDIETHTLFGEAK